MCKKYYRMMLFLIFIHILLFGCAKPPTEEMIKAEKAIDEAKQVQADIFANEVFMRAEESFQSAKESVAERKYEEARLIALDTYHLARQSVTIASVNKENIVNETEHGIQDIRVTIDELKSIEAQSFSKRASIQYDELQEILTKLETELGNIREKLRNNEVMAARDDLKSLNSEIQGLKQEVSVSLKAKKKKR